MDSIIIVAGIAKIIPSILSSIPPCPGKIFPVSLTLASLLKYEIIKSPNWHANDINKQNKIIFPEKSFSRPETINIPKGNNENKKEPKLPETVLFGLILVSFLPPKLFPIIYP